MNLPAGSVRLPITTTMLTLIVVVIGAFSLVRLPVDLLPTVEMPTLTVRTSYRGASPEVMERLVTQILEEIIATVPGVEEITSESEEGESRVRVTFAWGTDIDTAALDVRSTIEDEIDELPEDVERPRIRKFDIASFPVVLLGVSSDIDPVELTHFTENELRYRFGRIPGLAQVDTWGGFRREVRIEVLKDRLQALGVPLERVLQAVRDANLDLPAGKIEDGRHEVALRAPAEFVDLDQIRGTVVALREGIPVTIGQLARVVDTYERPTEIDRINGVQGIRVALRKQATANTVDVSRRILEEIDRINAAFPQVRVVPVSNQGNFIERSIANVANSVLYGGGLAVLVLLLFLRDLRSTVVIALAIPISIVATFSLLYLGGLTLNLMTLGGLALGVGMMVDNSIVVLENIFRHRDEEHRERVDAAVRGAAEVGPAIVASTLTTLVIFLPLVFVQGVSGILFQELALVVVFSLFCSLVVALSVVPMLASRLVHSPDERARARAAMLRPVRWLADLGEGLFRGLDRLYHGLLSPALARPWLTVLFAAGVLAASTALVPLIGTEFLPPSDEGEVRVDGELEVGTRLDIVDRQTRRMEDIARAVVPEAIATVSESNERAQSELRISLGPALGRERSNVEVAEALRAALAGRIPGTEVRVRAPQGQFLLERVLGGDEGLTVEVRGYDLEVLELLAARVADSIRDVSGITDVVLTRERAMPQEELRIDRDKAADLGLDVRTISETLETAIAGSEAGEFRAEGESYRILVQLQDAEQLSIEDVLDLGLSAPSGQQVALRNVVVAESTSGPIRIDRKDQQRIATVSANVAGRDLGSVAAAVRERLDRIPLPPGFELQIAGRYEEQQRSFRELFVTLMLALVLVYMVLACQYESLGDPLLVMLAVPMAGVGVLVVLFLTDTTLNVQSAIGCIMLGGIVVNNAILLVDQAGRLRAAGLGVREAAQEAGRRRLRPILMTALTTILGLLPLALGIGEGADAQAPLARAVIGGLGFSTLVTLLLVPAAYRLMHRERAAPVASAAPPVSARA